MLATALISGLAIFGACSATPVAKRTIKTDISLYPYGNNVSGLLMHYNPSDSLLYLAADDNAASMSTVTWDIDTNGDSTWNATIDNTTSIGSLYIIEGGSKYQPVGVTDDASSNVTTLGFAMLGTQVMWVDGSEYEAQFWAKPTNTTGVWALLWNSNGTSAEANSVPVTLKTTEPTVLSI